MRFRIRSLHAVNTGVERVGSTMPFNLDAKPHFTPCPHPPHPAIKKEALETESRQLTII